MKAFHTKYEDLCDGKVDGETMAINDAYAYDEAADRDPVEAAIDWFNNPRKLPGGAFDSLDGEHFTVSGAS